MPPSVRLASAEDLPRCFALRREVFVLEQLVPIEEDLDGRDDACTHFLAEVDGVSLGTARMRVVSGGKTAKAERVAVRRAARGLGLGRLLMEALQAEAARVGCEEVLLAAQVQVIPFYERLGYHAEGDEFLDAGIRHRWMRRSA